MKRVYFFPGKNTPLKRYVSYFRSSLILDEGCGSIVLCHSCGLSDALTALKDAGPRWIVSMDGVVVKDIPPGIKVICFRPEHKRGLGDEALYHKIIYYDGGDNSHHPYMIKRVRDQIVQEITYVSDDEDTPS